LQELLFGRRYRAIEKIGSGGMADVYRAVDETLGRTVAVKVMHARFAAAPEFAARFRQEAQAAANLVSPHIVNMYDWGHDGGTYYMVMEYVRGSDLKALESRGALPSLTVAEIGAQVCSALSVAHGYDVIHRDVKPHNIMVQPDGSVKVMDFGIARAGNSTLTQTGSVLGTAQYISPEQAQGGALTAASDLYSLGIVLYEAATGRLPFNADNPVSVALMQVNAEADPPHVANPGIDPALEAIIVRAMQKQTADRYCSAGEMRLDLLAIGQGGVAETAVLPTTDKTAVMPVVRAAAASAAHSRKWPWLLAAALLLVAGVAAALSSGHLGVGTGVDARPVGSVPDATATTTAGSKATVESAASTASQAAETVAVPGVVGMSEADAFSALNAAGFSPQALPSEYNRDVAVNVVFAQNPSGDESASTGSIVNYIVSRGADPAAHGGDNHGKSGKSKND